MATPLFPAGQTDVAGFQTAPPGQTYSGVYDPLSDDLMMRPSTPTELGAAPPPGMVSQFGGHGEIAGQMNAAGMDPSSGVGFTATNQADGSIKYTWNSTSVNDANWGDRTASPAAQEAIQNRVNNLPKTPCGTCAGTGPATDPEPAAKPAAPTTQAADPAATPSTGASSGSPQPASGAGGAPEPAAAASPAPAVEPAPAAPSPAPAPSPAAAPAAGAPATTSPTGVAGTAPPTTPTQPQSLPSDPIPWGAATRAVGMSSGIGTFLGVLFHSSPAY